MKVLSLFNGISCGRVALDRAGIEVERYVSYEIDKYANQVSVKNYPNDEYLGDVFSGDFTQYKGFDLLIGGSPCTFWSIAKRDREVTSDGFGFELFKQYARALNESECKYFLYENNHSIHKDIKIEITKYLGVEPIVIDSSLVSAQRRKRCYWTNIPNIKQPNDLNIFMKDILQSGLSWTDKAYCLTSSYGGAVLWNTLERKQRSMIAEPLIIKEATKKGYIIVQAGECSDYTQPNSKTRRGRAMKEKSNCLTTTNQYFQYIGKIDLPDGEYIVRKLTPIECERLQTLPDNYTDCISDTQRYKSIGNGWTVDVIAHIFKGLIKDSITSS